MKIMLLALLFPVLCYAQSEKAYNSNAIFQDSIEKTSFYLKDTRIVYQKVFTSRLPQKELSEQVYRLLSTAKNFRFDFDGISNVEFYGRLRLHQFDGVRYNTTLFNSPILLNLPLNAIVVVQVKDFKYRLTISEVEFIGKETTYPLDNQLTQYNRSKLNLTKSNSKLATYLDKDFTDLFEVKNTVIASDF
jgi:hypothetical protein